MSPTTLNRLIPLLIVLMAAVTLPLLLLAFYRPANLYTQAADQPRMNYCQPPTLPKYVCNINPQTRKPFCRWQCVPAPLPSIRPVISPMPTNKFCSAPDNCPLECIIVTDINGCDICRCDL